MLATVILRIDGWKSVVYPASNERHFWFHTLTQPIHIVIGILSNLFTLALLGTDSYLFREWDRLKDSPYDYVRDDAQRYLIWAVGLIVFALLGGLIIKFLLGKSGSDEPTMERSSESTTPDRPEGHPLFVEFSGPKKAQPLILIHGWSSDSTQWYYLATKWPNPLTSLGR